ncbi:hypothetical protein [Streptomyces sp. NPDC093991]|uniref:hypothetical protein n=1 Tax=unclassified Streptomyces TaxID=2593676 RepID=UPI003444D399
MPAQLVSRIKGRTAATASASAAGGIASSDGRCDGHSHNKPIVFDAKYAGQWRKAVFVGSYDPTGNSATQPPATRCSVSSAAGSPTGASSSSVSCGPAPRACG